MGIRPCSSPCTPAVRACTVSVQDARRDELRGAPRPRETGRQKKREPAGPAETIADPTTSSSLYVRSVEKAMTVLTRRPCAHEPRRLYRGHRFSAAQDQGADRSDPQARLRAHGRRIFRPPPPSRTRTAALARGPRRKAVRGSGDIHGVRDFLTAQGRLSCADSRQRDRRKRHALSWPGGHRIETRYAPPAALHHRASP